MTTMEFLRFIVSALVLKTDAIEISEKQDELGTFLSLHVDPSDMGSLIGRGGKTIEAVRTVLRVFGTKAGIRLNLRIVEENREVGNPV